MADFARVHTLLTALRDPTGAKRNAEVYKKGNWERGGFLKGTFMSAESYLALLTLLASK